MISGNKTTARSAWPGLRVSGVSGRSIRGLGLSVLSVFPAGAEPWRAGAVSLGSAKPIACDATGRSDLDAVARSGTMARREDGTVRRRVSLTDRWRPASRGPGVRRPGPRLGQRPALAPGQRHRLRCGDLRLSARRSAIGGSAGGSTARGNPMVDREGPSGPKDCRNLRADPDCRRLGRLGRPGRQRPHPRQAHSRRKTGSLPGRCARIPVPGRNAVRSCGRLLPQSLMPGTATLAMRMHGPRCPDLGRR
jgi:hypothetical protein